MRWEAVDDRSALGALTEGDVTLTMLFTFNPDGLIETVSARSRGRLTNGKISQTPWQGRFWNYEARAGMRVPLDGEVAWIFSKGPKPYWRGHVSDIAYEWAK